MMKPQKELSCRNIGCTFQGSSRLGKRNHETRCSFSHRKKRVIHNNNAFNRSALSDSDTELVELQPENTGSSFQSDTLSSYRNRQAELKQVSERINPDLDPIEGDERNEKEVSKCEQVAIILSEIAHKAGKKNVDELLHLLQEEVNIHELTTRFRDVETCHSYVDEYVVRHLHKEGFTEQNVDSVTGLEYTVFSRDPNAVIRNQIAAAGPSTCFFSPVEEFRDGKRCYTHPMAAPACHTIEKVVKNAVMRSTNTDVLWKSVIPHGSESFVGVGQMYSDKSSVTLKARGFQFYPVHLVLLNLSENLRRSMITSGASIVGYLPVSFQLSEPRGKPNTKFRKQVILSVHEALQTIFHPLIISSEKGITGVDSQGISRTCHLAIGAYCADIPEAKDMTGVLHGSSTASPCFRCLAPTSEMNAVTNAEMRNLGKTMELISESQKLLEESKSATPSVRKKMKENSENLLKGASLAGIAPALSSFPFVGLCPELDVFWLHLYETLHNLHLGVSKLIKQACADRLTDHELQSNALSASNGRMKTFASIRARILGGANEILRQLEKEFPARGFRTSFGSESKGGRYNGFFKNNGVVGMLEAKDYQALDMVFPFIGAYIDRCCGEIESSPTTRIFTKYSEIVAMVYRRNMEAGWTEGDLHDLRRRVVTFKNEAAELYGPYQSSEMGTLKFHLLDHLVDDIRRMGGVGPLDAGLYEHSHLIVKRWYSKTSKRRETAMSESMELMHRSQAYKRDSAVSERSRKVNKNVSLVRDGFSFSLNALVLARRRFRQKRKDSIESNVPISADEKHAELLVMDIGEDGARVLIKLLRKVIPHGLRSKAVVQRVKSGFVAGGFVPDLSNFNPDSCTTRLMNPPQLQSQRIVAARNFAGSEGMRQDCVIIEAEDDGGSPVLWVARVLALIRVNTTGEKSSKDGTEVLELAFLQYFEAVHPRDEVDRQLNCICLKWAKALDDEDNADSTILPNDQEKAPCKWFDLQPVDFIRGTVHVVSTEYVLDKKNDELCWWNRFFYVNRFYYDSRAIKI